MEQHIRSQFDKDLEAVQAHLLRMGALVETALVTAADALDRLDLELAHKVQQEDRAIDELRDLIDAECAQIIALRAPIASDLRVVLVVMRIANSLERVGDYAKNAAKRTHALASVRQINGTTSAIRRMAQQVAGMLDDALRAMVTRDVDLATKVRDSDVEVDESYGTQFRALITHMLENPANISTAMHLHFIAKNFERAGDHATTIAEQAIYLATGKLPAEERPKLETSRLIGTV
jgi:phosphate transport system protein